MSIFFPEDEGREVPNVDNQPILRTEIIAGAAGPTGSQGPVGPAGPGVVTGGFTGQVLAKKSNANYDTEWVTGGGGGSAIWGGIAGTLSNQTDLQTVLDAKAPSSGISPSAISGIAVITTDSRLSDPRTPTGAASGDLGGTYPAPEVIKLRGYSVSLTSPSDNQAILFNSSATAFQNSTLTVGTISGLSADLSGKAETTDIQIFTTTGSWTKPTNAKTINVQLFGGGGGGGSGRRDTTALTPKSGGGGGGGGSYLNITIPAIALATTESVVIGAGGAGGAGSTASPSGNGATAISGGNTTFSSFICSGGSGGSGGTANPSNGGIGVLSANNGSASNITGVGGNGAPSTLTTVTLFGGAGGAAAGAISISGVAFAGGNGGRSSVLGFAGGTGGAAGSAGAAGTNNVSATSGLFAVGSGGGGGGAGLTISGGAGGAGGFPACGGGGGGPTQTGTTSGSGGAGGDGLAVITTYF
jgi:hypothetical protein